MFISSILQGELGAKWLWNLLSSVETNHFKRWRKENDGDLRPVTGLPVSSWQMSKGTWNETSSSYDSILCSRTRAMDLFFSRLNELSHLQSKSEHSMKYSLYWSDQWSGQKFHCGLIGFATHSNPVAFWKVCQMVFTRLRRLPVFWKERSLNIPASKCLLKPFQMDWRTGYLKLGLRISVTYELRVAFHGKAMAPFGWNRTVNLF